MIPPLWIRNAPLRKQWICNQQSPNFPWLKSMKRSFSLQPSPMGVSHLGLMLPRSPGFCRQRQAGGWGGGKGLPLRMLTARPEAGCISSTSSPAATLNHVGPSLWARGRERPLGAATLITSRQVCIHEHHTLTQEVSTCVPPPSLPDFSHLP